MKKKIPWATWMVHLTMHTCGLSLVVAILLFKLTMPSQVMASLVYILFLLLSLWQIVQESKRLVAASFNCSDSATAILNDQGVLLVANDAWNTYSAKYGSVVAFCDVGENWIKQWDGLCRQGSCKDDSILRGLRAVFIGDKQEYSFEKTLSLNSNNSCWICVRVRRFEDGKQTRIVVVCEDITNRKRDALELKSARENADSSNKTKSEFLANMSHEIRTPLTAVLGFAEFLLDQDDIETAPPERIEAIKTIILNGEYLLGLINEILDLSKIEAGAVKVEHVPCSPSEIIAEVESLMRVRADAKEIRLSVHIDALFPETIQTDPTRLRQILLNFLSNAIKFTEVGEVKLVARILDCDGPDPMLQIDVIDSGIGLTDDQMAKLFMPFTQADNSITRKYGGTGLGLTISKRLAEILGGTITATSIYERGSTFSLILPTESLRGVKLLDVNQVNKPALTTKIGELTPDQLSKTRPKLNCRVLLADDVTTNRKLISMILAKAGATTTLAENGEIAVELAEEANNSGQPFDVILMDMQMPVLDGLSATWLLRQQKYDGPIIALTALTMQGDREKCLAAGCNDYISKPIDRHRLVSLVGEYADRKTIVTGIIETESESGLPHREKESGDTCQQPVPTGPSSTAEPLFDPLPGLRRLQNDRPLFNEMVKTFLEFSSQFLSDIEQAIDEDDCEAVGRTAHSLKGALADFTTKSPVDTARLLEEKAAANDLNNADEMLSQLTQDVRQLAGELHEFLDSKGSKRNEYSCSR